MTFLPSASYWISPNAIRITLNALGDPNKILGSLSSGAVIMAFAQGVDGLDYNDAHNYRTWQLSLANVQFSDDTPRYVYAAIPRPSASGSSSVQSEQQALIVFPSVKIDLYGKVEAPVSSASADDSTASQDSPVQSGSAAQEPEDTQFASTSYYYIFLGGIISEVKNNSRSWLSACDFGKLSTAQAIDEGGVSSWWSWDPISDTVKFLKHISEATFLKLTSKQAHVTGTAVIDGATELGATLTVTGAATLKGNTTLGGNIQSDSFVTGAPLTGSGWQITKDGEIQADTLRLRTALEVPELRFNRASIIAGTNIQSPCAGIIKSVTPTSATTGIASLDLGDDDIAGSIAVGDLCWGYWHDISTKSNNATADSDDHSGNINYRGFATVYFHISEILNANSTQFKYELRPETNADGSPKFPLHPYPQMHFGGRGSTKDKSRQGFTIATPHYTATYQLVSSWDWDDQVKYIVRVSGRLDGFEALAGREAGSWNNHNGTIDTNLYVRGNINKVTLDRRFLYITQSSNGILEPDETETVTILIRDSAFNNLTAAYTITVGDQTYTKKDEVTIQFAYSDLTQEVTRIPVTATYGEETLTATITLRKLAPQTLEMVIDVEGDSMVAKGETKTVHFRVKNNNGFWLTDQVDHWRIERFDPDTELPDSDDDLWNAKEKAKAFNRLSQVSVATIQLKWSDYASENDFDPDESQGSTSWRVTATIGDEQVIGEIGL